MPKIKVRKSLLYLFIFSIIVALYFFVVILGIPQGFYYHEKSAKIIDETYSANGKYYSYIQCKGGSSACRVFIKDMNSYIPFFDEEVIFVSFDTPVPKKINFIGNNKLEVICKRKEKFTITFNPETLEPDKKLIFYKGELK